jgi:hypothetical protein
VAHIPLNCFNCERDLKEVVISILYRKIRDQAEVSSLCQNFCSVDCLQEYLEENKEIELRDFRNA